ncbi:hypothetical protein ACIBAC_08810 [Streptomyces sp. NPDC051362]|uniref:hypothetical protein n=1 Tax=Streptomyces sp. NPDC051362 TaxID=3365651 RepID=UPI00378E797E
MQGTREGLAAARARDRVRGRPTVATDEVIKAARDLLPDPGRSITSIAKLLGFSPGTLYHHIPGPSETTRRTPPVRRHGAVTPACRSDPRTTTDTKALVDDLALDCTDAAVADPDALAPLAFYQASGSSLGFGQTPHRARFTVRGTRPHPRQSEFVRGQVIGW